MPCTSRRAGGAPLSPALGRHQPGRLLGQEMGPGGWQPAAQLRVCAHHGRWERVWWKLGHGASHVADRRPEHTSNGGTGLCLAPEMASRQSRFFLCILQASWCTGMQPSTGRQPSSAARHAHRLTRVDIGRAGGVSWALQPASLCLASCTRSSSCTCAARPPAASC